MFIFISGCEYLPEDKDPVEEIEIEEPSLPSEIEAWKPGKPNGYMENDLPQHLKNQPTDDWQSNSTSYVFYLKYFANDGKGCLLLPRRIKLTEVDRVELDGEETRRPYYPVLDDRGIYRNGGRGHCRLNTTGDTFQNVDCIIYYNNGTTEVFPVGSKNHPDGYKKKY